MNSSPDSSLYQNNRDDYSTCNDRSISVIAYLSMGTVVLRLVPSGERVKARKGSGWGVPVVVMANCSDSMPPSESLSVAVMGVVCRTE